MDLTAAIEAFNESSQPQIDLQPTRDGASLQYYLGSVVRFSLRAVNSTRMSRSQRKMSHGSARRPDEHLLQAWRCLRLGLVPFTTSTAYRVPQTPTSGTAGCWLSARSRKASS